MKAPSILLLLCLIPGCAFGQASNMISITALRQESSVASGQRRADIHHLMKTAQTAEDFGRLADYFARQAEIYAAKCDSEQKELDRLLALRYHARSYPAQLENTRNRVEHFKALSHKFSEQATAYRARMTILETTTANPDPTAK